MQRLTFINKLGQRAVFDSAAPYIFWKVSGIGLPPVEPSFTQATGQHGYTLHSILLESRTVTLTGHIHGKSGVHALYEERRRLNAVCNPLMGPGTLLYENDYGAWRIPAFCKAAPYENKIREVQTLDISFECPAPFWLSTDQSAILLAYVEGGLEFPIVTPEGFGVLGYRVTADNDSDTDVPVEMRVDGGSTNPVIKNVTTGEFILIEKPIQTFESLYINTDPEKMEVTLHSVDPVSGNPTRSNAYGYLSYDSTLFSLAPGANEIIFESEDENKLVRIRMYYYKRYTGV